MLHHGKLHGVSLGARTIRAAQSCSFFSRHENSRAASATKRTTASRSPGLSGRINATIVSACACASTEGSRNKSATVQPNIWANCCNLSRFKEIFPLSIREIVSFSTAIFSAICACVRPARLRRAARPAPTSFANLLLFIFFLFIHCLLCRNPVLQEILPP